MAETRMPLTLNREGPALGCAGPVGSLPGWGISAELHVPPEAGMRLRLWVSAAHGGSLYFEAGEVWAECWMGAPVWVCFKLAFVALNCAVFEAAEVRSGLDPVQRPQGVLWLPTRLRSLPSGPTA